MRIVVMAAGGVGGYFGAKLALAGNDVVFVARGRHLAALHENGLRVRSGTGDLHVARPALTDDPGAIAEADAVLFAVKLWDTESAAQALRPLVARNGVVVPFQNGVESIDRIAAVVGEERVMGGVAYIGATIAEPGVIAHTGTMARLRIGAALPSQQNQAEALVAACKGAGIDVELAADIRRALWEKFVFLSAFSGVSSVARQPIGVIRADTELRATLEAAMRETWTVGRARGVRLADDFVEQQMKFGDSLPAEMRSSMQNDLAAGNRLEAPWLCGAVARMAAAGSIAAPVNATLYAALKPYCQGSAH